MFNESSQKHGFALNPSLFLCGAFLAPTIVMVHTWGCWDDTAMSQTQENSTYNDILDDFVLESVSIALQPVKIHYRANEAFLLKMDRFSMHFRNSEAVWFCMMLIERTTRWGCWGGHNDV